MGHAERERPKMPVYLDTRNRVLLTRDLYPASLLLVAPATLVFTLYRFARKRAWRQGTDRSISTSGSSGGYGNRASSNDNTARTVKVAGI